MKPCRKEARYMVNVKPSSQEQVVSDGLWGQYGSSRVPLLVYEVERTMWTVIKREAEIFLRISKWQYEYLGT